VIRTIACSLLVAISLAIVAPAFAPAPAHAESGATTQGPLPPVPWAKVAQWVLKNALPLLMLAEEIWRDMQGADQTPPPEQPPAPTPGIAPEPEPSLEIAFAAPLPSGCVA
jgi:hypothetical protein